MAEGVQVEGLDRLNADLDRLGRRLPAVAPPAVAALIGREAVMRAPKRTGHLAGSFSGTTTEGAQLLGFGAVYAGPVHFGVGARPGLRGPHNIRPNPFLFGAVADTEARWLGEYETDLQSLVDEVRGA